jgi:hypothetical protein
MVRSAPCSTFGEIDSKLAIQLNITDNQCCTVLSIESGKPKAALGSDRRTAKRGIMQAELRWESILQQPVHYPMAQRIPRSIIITYKIDKMAICFPSGQSYSEIKMSQTMRGSLI